MRDKALIAMSGGVDSSVAAFLMLKKEFDCTGAMMKLYADEHAEGIRNNGCCSLSDAEDARAVAFSLGIPFYVFNFTECFTEKVIRRSMPAPVYVCSICSENNSVVVGTEHELYSKTLTANDINLIPVEKLDTPIKAKAKIRYRQPEQPVTVRQIDPDTLHLTFETPQRAITKGQAVVLYDGDIVIGGGTIV